MAWTIEYTDTARRSLKRMDRQMAKRILDYMDERVSPTRDPRKLGKALSGVLGDLWCYRIGDYRVMCDIQDKRICVLVLDVGHRGEVYRLKR